MYKFEVEYMKTENDKFAAMIFCTECDFDGTKEIFKYPVPSENGIIGQDNFIPIDHVVTNERNTLDEVENDIKNIINDLKNGIEGKRSLILKSETWEI